MQTTTVFGILASILSVASTLPYIRDTLFGTTKPHAFSWLVWSLTMLIASAGQLAAAGGIGGWVTGLNAGLNLVIFFLSLSRGERTIDRLDWICLIAALSAIPLWVATSTPLWSVLLVTLIDGVGFVPTFRKAFKRPSQETVSLFALGGLAWFLSLFSLESLSLITLIYPATICCSNTAFCLMVYYRRRASGL